VACPRGSQPIPSTATFSYPIGQLDVNGPGPYYLGSYDYWWDNGANCAVSHCSDGWVASFGNPTTLVFGTSAPLFDVGASFRDQSDIYPDGAKGNGSAGEYINWGNESTYKATLWKCDINAVPANQHPDCTDYAGNGGWSVPVGTQDGFLHSPGTGLTAFGDLAIPAGGQFDAMNFANTFQIQYQVNEHDSHGDHGSRQAAGFTQPFNAVVIPSALIQLSVVPYTILYAPPGNQSTVSFTTKANYGTSISLGNSTTQSNSWTTANSTAIGASLNLAISGTGFSVNGSNHFDESTKKGFGLTNDAGNQSSDGLAFTDTIGLPANRNLVPGNGGICPSATSCPPGEIKYPSATDLYFHESFWRDTFVLLVHPQFAAYVLGGGQDRYVMTAAVPARAEITVADLDSCRLGQTVLGEDPCEVPFSDSGLTGVQGGPVSYSGDTGNNYCPDIRTYCLHLSPNEAANLLRLDSFYGGGQGASLPATRAAPIGGYSYGVETSVIDGQVIRTPLTQSLTLDNTMANASSNATKTTEDTTVTDVWGSSVGGGLSVGLGTGIDAKEGFTISDGDTTTDSTDIATSYSDSTAVSNSQVTSAQVTLGDLDNATPSNGGVACSACHGPMPFQQNVNVYLDRLFGSFMFQDRNVPPPPALCCSQRYQGELANVVAGDIVAHALGTIRFTDVSANSRASHGIDVLASLGLMSGDISDRFHPSAPLSESQLAITLSSAVKLPVAQALKLFNLSPQRGKQAVSEALLVTAIARALKVTAQTAKRYLTQALPNRAFSGQSIVTRAEAAQALFDALKARCLENCRYSKPHPPAAPIINDFALSVSPSSASVKQGSSVSTSLDATVVSGSIGTLSLAVRGLPQGAIAAFKSTRVMAGHPAKLMITAAKSTPPGTYPITVIGKGNAGVHTVTYGLIVTR
jgi:hypothetical protein